MLNKIFISLLLLVISISAFADLGHRNVPLFQSRRLQFGIEAQSFRSTKNFIENGKKEILPSGFRYLSYDVLLSTMYDLSNEWALSLDLNVSYAESFNTVTIRNNRKLKDIKLGIYRLYDLKEYGQVILDGYYLFNFVENDVDQDQVSVSDGISWLQFGAWWQPSKLNYSLSEKELDYQKKFGQKSEIQPTIRTYLGFRTRPNFSDLIILKIHPQFKTNKFIFGAEFNSQFSVIKESNSDKIQKALLNQRYNASSFRYNAWNPTVYEVLLWLGFQPNPYTQFKFGTSQILGAENTADGFGVFFDWQTSMIATSSGMIFTDFFDKLNEKNPKKNTDIKIKNYGPEPKVTPQVKPSDLQDL